MLITALLLGLFGSVHCLAMCGPLVLAFSKQMSSFKLKLLQQLGRLTGYVVLGLIMGFVGNTLVVFTVQQKVSLVVGALLIVLTFYSIFRSKSNDLFGVKWLSKMQSFLMKNTHNKHLRFFSLGIINALLPCGLLFLALGSAITMGSPLASMTYMLVFGLGTFPSLFLVAAMGPKIMGIFNGYQKRLIPALTITMGMFLVVRGLGLGIPYISPTFNATKGNMECHNENETSTNAMCGSLPELP